MNKKILLISIGITFFLLTSLLLYYYFFVRGNGNNPNQVSNSAKISSQQDNETETSNRQQYLTYSIVDTGQESCYNEGGEISCSNKSLEYYGQDGSFEYVPFSYTDNKDGTISDNNTGLMWQQSADVNSDGKKDINDKMLQKDAVDYCDELTLANYFDWRLPDIKTLYSLMNFKGTDPSADDTSATNPFISTTYFDFDYGNLESDERIIDSQWATTSIYVGKVMNNQQAMFGLNLADGRIKGYPTSNKLFNVKCVRSNQEYGINDFVDNGDGTITDNNTELMWQKSDSVNTYDWKGALNYCNDLNTAQHNDWRLPNAKELQSISDYSRSPDTTNSAAIDELFSSTSFTNENNQKDWGFYWSSTTHLKSTGAADSAVYLSFGRALGYMNGKWMDVHGAGAQRSDPKAQLSTSQLNNSYQVINGVISHGPQGDAVRTNNYVRCVRRSSRTYNGAEPDKSNNSTNYEDNTTTPTNSSSNTPTPPTEAIDACSNKSSGASCNFIGSQQKSVSGTCKLVNLTLACVP